jgi:hypothetical protein
MYGRTCLALCLLLSGFIGGYVTHEFTYYKRLSVTVEHVWPDVEDLRVPEGTDG